MSGFGFQGVRVFASASDAPLTRRPGDAVSFAVLGLLTVAISALAAEPRQFETDVYQTFADLRVLRHSEPGA